jgi:LysM repeat protein
MSESMPETGDGGGGNPLRVKFGPLPVWGWLIIVTGLGVAYYLYEKRKSASAGSSGTSTTMSGAAGIPDYVSQTTVNLTEPPGQPPVTAAPPPSQPPPPGPKKGTRPPVKSPAPPPAKKPGGSGQPPLMSGKYTVKAGDTLDKIAARYHISRVDLAHANGLGTGAGLKTGQELKVPGPLVTRAEGGPG